MSKNNVIRAWKNEEYRNSLTAAERAQLPENPAGLIELTCEELVSIDGSAGSGNSSTVCEIMGNFTRDGGTICGTKDITCSRSTGNHGLTAKAL